MKQLPFKTFIAIALLSAGLSVTACKSKTANAANTDTTSTNTSTQPDNITLRKDTMPVTISPDDSLTSMTKDAVKDYPGVTASVNNGEVTLTGNITRDKLPKLMQAIQAMHPKKVNNNLTIK